MLALTLRPLVSCLTKRYVMPSAGLGDKQIHLRDGQANTGLGEPLV